MVKEASSNPRPQDVARGVSRAQNPTMSVTVPAAIDAYLTDRASELSDSSIQNHRYQLKQFREWCNGPGETDSISAIEPLDLSKFRRYRSADINPNTMYNQLSVCRLFLRFCHRMGWCEEEIPNSIVLPTRAGRSRDDSIDPDRVASILDKLETYRYASFDHVLLSLLWTCSFRIGAIRAFDVQDLHLNERWVDVVHRPETGTPLKNKEDSEREVNLHGWVCDVLRAWVKDVRPDVEDDHRREPLLSTQNGRVSRATIRRHVYNLTDCSGIDGGCDCVPDYAKCPSASVAPHDIRRSSITAWLDDGTDISLLSGRVDSSQSTLSEHYDVRTETQKRELRRNAFDM